MTNSQRRSRWEGPAAWIAAIAAIAAVVVALLSTGIVHVPDGRDSLSDALETTTTLPAELPTDAPVRAGPVVVPDVEDGGVTCRSVSGGPTPGLYCLVSFLVRSDDPREHWLVAEVAYGEGGPWTVVVRDRMRDGDDPDNLLSSTLDLRAPSRVYVRGFATFADAEPFLPRSTPSTPVLVDLQTDGTLRCAHPHEIDNDDGTTTHLCAFSGDANYSSRSVSGFGTLGLLMLVASTRRAFGLLPAGSSRGCSSGPPDGGTCGL